MLFMPVENNVGLVPILNWDAREITEVTPNAFTTLPNIGSLGGIWTSPSTGPIVAGDVRDIGGETVAYMGSDNHRQNIQWTKPDTDHLPYLLIWVGRYRGTSGFRHAWNVTQDGDGTTNLQRLWLSANNWRAPVAHASTSNPTIIAYWNADGATGITGADKQGWYNNTIVDAGNALKQFEDGKTYTFTLGSGKPTYTNNHFIGDVAQFLFYRDAALNDTNASEIFNSVKTLWGI